MANVMASGYLRLKAAELLEQHETNLHRASQKGSFSYPTMWRYINKPKEVESMHMRSVVGLLVDALGLEPHQIEEMKFGEIFQVVLDSNGNGSK